MLTEDEAGEALARLQVLSSPLGLGQPVLIALCSYLWPVYIRGEAYQAAGQASAAVGEFQKIIDHPGIVINCPTGALAHLGLARAYALEAGVGRALCPPEPDAHNGWCPPEHGAHKGRPYNLTPSPRLAPPTRTSSPSGRMPTLTSLSSSRPRRSMPSCSHSLTCSLLLKSYSGRSGVRKMA
jgi:hypothetical protein